MLNKLPAMPIPRWLADLSSTTIKDEPFPLDQVLKDSLYYPSSGFDADPIRYLAGNVLSFIYVDYGYSQDALERVLYFSGYNLIASRQVTKQELTPRGWNPTLPNRSDGDPSRYIDSIKKPFCLWSVFQRDEAAPVSHGPSRFSLLYLCADGVAAFQALYIANNASPKAVAVIQPGHAFGFNWTDYTDPKQIFARTVFGNPAGQPELFLYGGYGTHEDYRESCWPQYTNPVRFFNKRGKGRIGVWSISDQREVTS